MKVKLGEICKVVSGSTPKTHVAAYWGGEHKWVTPAELKEDSDVITETERTLTREGVASAGLKALPVGTVLLSSRAPIGKVAIVGCEMYCNQGFKNLICSPSVYNRFLFWFLKSKKAFLNSLGRGATFTEISKQIVENIQINLPSLDRQREIVRVLDKVEAVIDKHKQQLAKLDELAKARFVEMLNNNKPKNIPISSVGNVFTGSTPPTADPANYEHRDIPFVKPSDLDMDYPVILDRIENYVAEKARGIVRMYPPNSVLVACIASVGKMGIATKPGTCNQQINVVVPDEGFHPVYIAHAIFSRQRYIIEAANKAVVPILNKRNFSQLTIPIIPLPLQRQFAEFVTHIERMKGKVRASLEATQKLLGSLMQEYFS